MAESELAKRFELIARELSQTVSTGIDTVGAAHSTGDRLLDEVVYAFLLWEAGPERADRAFVSLRREFIDHNELRVCLIDEMRAVIGKTYPRSEPRCIALRDALNAIFERCNGLSLVSLDASGKRELRAFFDSIPAVPAFVTARVCLTQGVHIFPLDARLQKVACVLVDVDIIDAGDTPEANATRIERALRAGEAARVYAVLEAVAATGVSEAAMKGTRAKGKPSPTGSEP